MIANYEDDSGISVDSLPVGGYAMDNSNPEFQQIQQIQQISNFAQNIQANVNTINNNLNNINNAANVHLEAFQ